MKDTFPPVPDAIPSDAEIRTSFILQRDTDFTMPANVREVVLAIKAMPDEEFIKGVEMLVKSGYDDGYETVLQPFTEVIRCLSEIVVCHIRHDALGVKDLLDAYVAKRVRLADDSPHPTH